jgi:thioredoxin reductase (NADPH)
MIPTEVKRLDCGRDDGLFAIEVEGGEAIRAKTIVIASGARYRRLRLENLHEYEGNGVWYWASPIEARLCTNEHVVLVGGGNSAGQAAVFLSAHAAKVTMMVRGDGLADTMSRYLIDRIESTPNIELLAHTEITALDGQPGIALERVTWRDRKSGEETKADVRNVFLFIGADPATDWLKDCGVELDRGGFVITGKQCSLGHGDNPLQSSVPGVFAVGDVRSGSVKRVGASIGEGAQVVAAVHGYLAQIEEKAQAKAAS